MLHRVVVKRLVGVMTLKGYISDSRIVLEPWVLQPVCEKKGLKLTGTYDTRISSPARIFLSALMYMVLPMYV